MKKRKKSKKPSQTHLPEGRHSFPPTSQSACHSPWLKVAVALRCLRSDPVEPALRHEARRRFLSECLELEAHRRKAGWFN
jgi:hypothetical protein